VVIAHELPRRPARVSTLSHIHMAIDMSAPFAQVFEHAAAHAEQPPASDICSEPASLPVPLDPGVAGSQQQQQQPAFPAFPEQTASAAYPPQLFQPQMPEVAPPTLFQPVPAEPQQLEEPPQVCS